MLGGRIVLAFFLACGMFVTVGCKSIQSTFLARDECNNGWTKVENLKGVPITLKVPTHLRVSIKETHYLQRVTAGGVQSWERVKLDVPVRTVDHDFIRTEKIFTVDFKRPPAGTMDLTLEMNEQDQYFKKIEHEVIDETIADVANLISKVAPTGLFVPTSGEGSTGLKDVVSTVAVEVFEIDDPMFELKLSEFLKCHLNKSHDAWVASPGVDGIQRVNLNDTHGQATDELCPPCIGASTALGGGSIGPVGIGEFRITGPTGPPSLYSANQ